MCGALVAERGMPGESNKTGLGLKIKTIVYAVRGSFARRLHAVCLKFVLTTLNLIF